MRALESELQKLATVVAVAPSELRVGNSKYPRLTPAYTGLHRWLNAAVFTTKSGEAAKAFGRGCKGTGM